MNAGSHPALAPEIDAFRRQFEQISTEGRALAASLTDDQFHWRPGPGSWSVGDCFEHLNVAARLYLPALDEGIANAIRRGLYGGGPFRYLWTGRLLAWTLEPPPRIRAKTVREWEPAPRRPRHDVMAAFRAYQVQFVDRLRQANGLDLARSRVRAPIARWVWMSLGSGFAVIAAHQRRHLWQAHAVARAALRA
jgi:hypothetical protein